MNVWVTGAAGMLGTEVVATLRQAGVDLATSDREVDITDRSAVRDFLTAVSPSPDWIVNCAAWTDVDGAEQDPDAAFALNAEGPAVLAGEAARIGARMVHISTDYVFDGSAGRPYRPDDSTNPRSLYGRSKLTGEHNVRRLLPAHVIIRTAWLYAIHGSNFLLTMLQLMGRRNEIGVVADQIGSPTCAEDLADAIGTVVTTTAPRAGTWHYVNGGATTWHGYASTVHELARRFALLDQDCLIRPLTTDQYPRPAPRPAYSVLDTTTMRRDWNVAIPRWDVRLERFFAMHFRSM